MRNQDDVCYRCKVRPRVLNKSYCRECVNEKALEAYYANHEEMKARTNAWRRKNYDSKKARAARLWTMYRVREEEFEEWEKQGCVICGSKKDLHIDHDHACCSGKKSCGKCVRGLLCKEHNVAIGIFQENYEHLIRAANYVKDNKWVLRGTTLQ